MIPPSQWRPGEIWRDEYTIPVKRNAPAPSILLVRVAIYDPEEDKDLPAFSPDNLPIELLLVGEARLGTEDGEHPQPGVALEIPLEEGISFVGYDLNPQTLHPGDELEITLHWRASDNPSQDYTVFVHLLDETGEWISGGDGPPLSGDYPTHLWQPEDHIPDTHTLSVPSTLTPGEYQLAAGLYDPTTGERLQRLDGNGDAVQWSIIVEGSG
jgi:hypothetical protein